MSSTDIDLTDYESYLDPDFKSTEFANELVMATNNPDDSNLDLSTPMKRLQFDLKDIDKKLKKLSNDNYIELIKNFNKLDELNVAVKIIDPSISLLNNSYDRLNNEIAKPYDEALTLHSALKRLHTTSTLLRSSTYFLYLIQQIEESFSLLQGRIQKLQTKSHLQQMQQNQFQQQQQHHSQQNQQYQIQDDPESFKLLLRCCRNQYSLKQHLSESPFLKSLKLVRDYELFLKDRNLKTLEICTSNIKSFNLNTSEAAMSNIILSLIYLSPETLYNLIQQILSTQTVSSISFLVHTLNSPKSFNSIMSDVMERAKYVSKLQTVMGKITWPLSETEGSHQSSSKNDDNINSNNNNSITERMSVLKKVTKILELQDILSTFWKDVAVGFEPKLRETLNKGGPVAKALRTFSEQIKNSVKANVVASCYIKPLKDDSIEVRMMLNSVRSLDMRR
ncbi:hypothetical protein B5S28_g1418 [[Candida] boidinii]|uniref:Unnamed protein product n=1 Tax=Candida boidinii TaxID=5477 RepID=A0ACB5TEB3_CANBO|nr:hypothetical protein B5S28_g1418 [[Candida] boidinii]OWB70634.1 hypothetical protein B5S31_g313 [[Candida] boidinii]OWB78509.1 hypothetical protein B5S32_g2705 [[Candida] boidinii]GME86842.1 unnamed protein product [[Candida] boidinii]